MISVIINVEQLKDGRLTVYKEVNFTSVFTDLEEEYAAKFGYLTDEMLNEMAESHGRSRQFQGNDLKNLVSKLKSEGNK